MAAGGRAGKVGRPAPLLRSGRGHAAKDRGIVRRGSGKGEVGRVGLVPRSFRGL